MRILIAGVAGFLGSHLADALISDRSGEDKELRHFAIILAAET